MDRFENESELYSVTSPRMKQTKQDIKNETIDDDVNVLTHTTIQRLMRKNREYQKTIIELKKEIEILKKNK